MFLTSWTEGADQLAARVALTIPGVDLVAVLPTQLSEYERDFQRDDGMGLTLAGCDLHTLVEACSSVYEFPSLKPLGSTVVPGSDDGGNAMPPTSGAAISWSPRLTSYSPFGTARGRLSQGERPTRST